ncbi:MAG: glycoside hydrolase [Planctomycetes bacterium]|nr:glycoside hydrolase [Planctomycetota bacterium]
MSIQKLGGPFLLLLACAASAAADQHPAAPSPPVRVGDVIGGHIHPSLARTRSGDLLAVYNEQGGGGKELLLSRSRDGGKSWSKAAAIPGIRDCSIYPGSLATLRDGRIVLHWSCYRGEGQRRWRVPQFSVSADEGTTWSTPKDLPLADHTLYSCLRHPVLELDDGRWVCPLYDRTIVYDPEQHTVAPFGDGRNHGMVPIVKTLQGTLISGAPQADSPVPVGKPGGTVRGLRSTNGGRGWQPLHALPYFGVAGYDLTPLENGWVVLTSIVYGVGRDDEWAFELIVSRDDGRTWDRPGAVIIYNPGRAIPGRGWPRTVQIDSEWLGTLFFDLDAEQPGGPGVFFVRTPLAALRPAAK